MIVRLILLLLAAAALVAVASFAVKAGRALSGEASSALERDAMPKTFQKIAYAALIILMFGVTTGFLGAG